MSSCREVFNFWAFIIPRGGLRSVRGGPSVGRSKFCSRASDSCRGLLFVALFSQVLIYWRQSPVFVIASASLFCCNSAFSRRQDPRSLFGQSRRQRFPSQNIFSQLSVLSSTYYWKSQNATCLLVCSANFGEESPTAILCLTSPYVDSSQSDATTFCCHFLHDDFISDVYIHV